MKSSSKPRMLCLRMRSYMYMYSSVFAFLIMLFWGALVLSPMVQQAASKRLCTRPVVLDQHQGLDGYIDVAWHRKYRQNVFKTTVEIPLPWRPVSLNSSGPPFHLVLNQGRSNKRKTRLSTSESARVQRDFDPSGFHFGKIDKAEYLYAIGLSDHSLHEPECFQVASVSHHAILINPFPLGHLSGLVVPHLHQHRPQVMTRDVLRTGLRIAQHFMSPWLRLAFNSLSAGASVNHLHYQFWHYPRWLPVEESAFVRWGTISNVAVLTSIDHPVHAVKIVKDSASMQYYSAAIMALITVCHDHNTPFNLILQRTSTIMLFRQAHKPMEHINIGFPEVSGELLVLDDQAYATLQGADIDRHWKEHVRLGDRDWQILRNAIQATMDA
eukprot:TRINITY_DN12117_c1_g1_i1.p1 TRINITY_DN12117_c1_g1~~TRINITY_DN12117_c1_g1_i1.p1  ORF type:complete len:383 (+),score=53.70 TRINITY_DN12117_c1_g1_i1:103-1251(+)